MWFEITVVVLLTGILLVLVAILTGGQSRKRSLERTESNIVEILQTLHRLRRYRIRDKFHAFCHDLEVWTKSRAK
jgi:type II secretory pathway pseudopilin PulG